MNRSIKKQECECVNTHESQSLIINDQLITEYMNSYNVASQLSENEKLQFISIAKAYQLNPFKREIYCIAYGQGERRKLNIITGYEVYLKRAERTGKLAGWKIICTGEGANMKACIEIHRKDWSMPLQHEVLFKEYSQQNSIWNSKPQTMLKKVAIAQGFRLAFPDELGGLPYDASELPSNGDMRLMVNIDDSIPKSKEEEDIKKEAPRKKIETTKGQALQNSSEPTVMQTIQSLFDECTTSEQLKEAANKVNAYKSKLSAEELDALRVMFNDMQEKLMGM